MIPQAIANIGPYADMWSHFKAMNHAFERVTKTESSRSLTDLDKSQLRSLMEFLKGELEQESNSIPVSFGSLGSQGSFEPTYSVELDLKQMLRNLPEFEQWHSSQKLGFDKKAQRLIGSLEDYLNTVSNDSLLNSPPKDEFKIIGLLLSKLLLHAESVLQT